MRCCFWSPHLPERFIIEAIMSELTDKLDAAVAAAVAKIQAASEGDAAKDAKITDLQAQLDEANAGLTKATDALTTVVAPAA